MTTEPVFRVDRVHPLVLPADGPARRPPRDPSEQQPGYLDQFDDRTVAYDVFTRDATTYLVGPPLLDLTLDAPPEAEVVQFGLPGQGFDKTARIALPAADPVHVTVSGHPLSGPAGSADLALFRDRRVLLTMSKDNDLDWVRDWATFHVSTQGVDAVLLYDNGSAYGPDAVARTLSEVEGLRVGVVVDWPFPYGPQGGPARRWDSDFCQVGGLEHARQKYVGQAAGLLNADVDELVLSSRPVFELAVEHGAVSYQGVWISAHREESEPEPHRGRLVYASYPFRQPGADPCAAKWCLDPRQLPARAWLGVHRAFRARAVRTDEVSYRHFMGVNTSWKYDRSRTRTTPGPEDRDHQLAAALASVERGPAVG